jgi:MoaA/NifB/PqqE/SkfB family radical SAM enzyme
VSRKLRLLSAYLRGLPIWCSWQVTPRCASLCGFCDHRAAGAFEEVDLATVRRIADELGRLGSLMISLSGGDPFLRDDLPEVVAALARHHFPLVTTHGWLVTAEKARGLWEAGLEAASITLDHVDPARQDSAAGQPGAHARAVGALRTLASTRSRGAQQVNVKARLRADTLDGLPALLELAAIHGATVSVEPDYPLPRDLVDAAVARRLRDLGRRHPNLRVGRFFLDRIDQALRGGVPGCQAGSAFFNIDHRGRVSKCLEFRGLEDRVGDLSRERIGDVLPRLRRRQEENECRACWMSSRGEVEGLYTVRGLLQAVPVLVRA